MVPYGNGSQQIRNKLPYGITDGSDSEYYHMVILGSELNATCSTPHEYKTVRMC